MRGVIGTCSLGLAVLLALTGASLAGPPPTAAAPAGERDQDPDGRTDAPPGKAPAGAVPNTDARLEALERSVERMASENAALREQAEADDALERRVEALERENRALSEKAAAAERKAEAAAGGGDVPRRPDARKAPIVRLGGYLDVGFFWAGGNGSGIRPDLGHRFFPEHEAVPGAWVFMGDPLTTMINSRGDPADLGGSRAILFDAIGNGGKPSFVVNTLNLAPAVSLGHGVSIEGLVDLLPRGRDVSDADGVGLGDFVDVKLAQIRWMTPIRLFELDLYAGKIDSVLGLEYQRQEAPERLTVTPSLLCRYTCGRSVGLAARFSFLERRNLHANVALTNGNNNVESFGLHDEIDANAFKTVSGRVAWALPLPIHLQIGASGAYGARDLQPKDHVRQWQWGVDLQMRWRDLELSGELVAVHVDGETSGGGIPCDMQACLDSLGAYGLASYRVLNWLVPFFRADWRDALHRHGADYVYASDVVRLSPGVAFPLGPYVVLKGEYNVNLELAPLPSFPNDVFTSSLVAHF